MTAKEALEATEKARLLQAETDKKRSEEERLRREEADQYSRTTGLKDFLNKTMENLTTATKSGKTHLQADATDCLVAELALASLKKDGYIVHKREHYVPENREYGDSGEGMHDAYIFYALHILWGKESGCPICNEEEKRRRYW